MQLFMCSSAQLQLDAESGLRSPTYVSTCISKSKIANNSKLVLTTQVTLLRKWYWLISKSCFSVSSEQQSLCSIEILGSENVLPRYHCLSSQMLRQTGGVSSASGASVAPEDPAFGRLWGQPTLPRQGFFQTEP